MSLYGRDRGGRPNVGARRHICCVTGCKSWVLAHYFCCHQHRAIMGPELYEKADMVWRTKPFDNLAWGVVHKAINEHMQKSHEETQAMLGRQSE